MKTGQGSRIEPSISELLEIPVFQDLADSFSKMTGIPLALLDLEGNILVASGWQRVCTDFHRKNSLTAARCLESDTILAGQLSKGQTSNIYKCMNGLIDVATPIIIENTHVGNLYAGQFLFDDPDMVFFEKQAEEFGFDKTKYLDAVSEVPVLTQSQIETAIEYLVNLTVLIGKAGIAKKKLIDLNRDLERQVHERTEKLETEKKVSESLISSLPGVMYVFDQFGGFKRWNKNFEKITGYSKEQINKMGPLEFIAPEDKDRVGEAIARVFETGDSTVEARLATVSGRTIPFLLTGFEYTLDNVKYLIGVGIDISDRVNIENEKANLIRRLRESLSEVKKLSGLLPVCASCKKIRDDKGYWNNLESYLHKHSKAKFSHSICPECVKTHYSEFIDDIE